MCSRGLLLVMFICLEVTVINIFGEVTFFNIECTSHDKSVGEFEFCHIKAINRSLKYASGKFLVRRQLTQASVTWTILKRENGWKPFLYNVTFDACKQLKIANKNPVVNHIFRTFKQYTNLNHTCPYDHDISVTNLPTTVVYTYWSQALPMPTGDYCLHTRVSTRRSLLAEIRFYIRST